MQLPTFVQFVMQLEMSRVEEVKKPVGNEPLALRSNENVLLTRMSSTWDTLTVELPLRAVKRLFKVKGLDKSIGICVL